MASGRSNISRSVWRFFEIALFFVVSVVGFSMYAKTTTFNAKQKSRALQQQDMDCLAELYSVNQTLFHLSFQHTVPAFAGKSSEASPDSKLLVSAAIRPDGSLSYPFLPHLVAFPLPEPVYTSLPRNLLQENPVLLT